MTTELPTTDLIAIDTETMSEDTKVILKNMEVIPIEENIFANLIEDFNPIFQTVRMYGTIEAPLFIANDIKKLLGLKDMQYSRGGVFKDGIHKVYIELQTVNGPKKFVAFTEFGLYVALMHSRVPLAESFQMFVYVVIKQLRLKGKVAADEAIKLYNKQVQINKNLEYQLDQEHEKAITYESLSNKFYFQLENTLEETDRWQKKYNNVQDRDYNKLNERFKRIFGYYGRPIILSIVDPPLHLKDIHEYDINDIIAWDEEAIIQDDPFIWTLSMKEPKDGAVPIIKFHIHKADKVDRILEYIRNRDSSVLNSKGDAYPKYVEGTLQGLEDLINDANKEFEKLNIPALNQIEEVEDEEPIEEPSKSNTKKSILTKAAYLQALEEAEEFNNVEPTKPTKRGRPKKTC